MVVKADPGCKRKNRSKLSLTPLVQWREPEPSRAWFLGPNAIFLPLETNLRFDPAKSYRSVSVDKKNINTRRSRDLDQARPWSEYPSRRCARQNGFWDINRFYTTRMLRTLPCDPCGPLPKSRGREVRTLQSRHPAVPTAWVAFSLIFPTVDPWSNSYDTDNRALIPPNLNPV